MTARGPAALVAGGGAVSALGPGLDALFDGVFAGRRGIAPLRRLAGTDALTEVAAELPPELVAAAGNLQLLPLAMARAAAEEALETLDRLGGREGRAELRASTGLVLATAKADLSGIDPASDDGAGGLGVPHRLLDELAAVLGLGGPRAAVSCACASGLSALALAGRWIASEHVARVLVVGVDVLTPFVLRGFSSLLALDPGPCRPFDRARRGLNLGEGAGAMLLHAAPDNRALGARLTGWGEANDANHVTGPSRDGAGLARAMERALRSANRTADDIDALHLHGTGTPYNDAMESQAAARVFTRQPPAFGTKAVTGHALGAVGLLESLVLVEALRRGRTPPQPGFETPDDGCVLDISAAARDLPRARCGLKVAAGFGGIDAALVFEWTPDGDSPS